MLAIIVKFFVGSLVIALMLGIGLAAEPRRLAQIVRQPRLYLRALLVLEIGVPLLAMAVVSGLALPPLGAGLILLMAICPGAPFIPMVTKPKGETYSTVGLDLLLLVSVLAPVSVPAWVAILDRAYGFDFQISPGVAAMTVARAVIVPLLVGFAVRALWPRAAAVLARVTHYVFLVGLVVALIAVIALGAPVFLEASPRTLIAAVLIVAGAAVMGLWAARHRPDARHATTAAAVLGNPGLALAVVAASYPGFRAGAFIAAYLILRKLVLLPFELWIKRAPPPPVASPPSEAEVPERPIEPQPVGA